MNSHSFLVEMPNAMETLEGNLIVVVLFYFLKLNLTLPYNLEIVVLGIYRTIAVCKGLDERGKFVEHRGFLGRLVLFGGIH